MTFADALAFWYGRVNYERKAPQPGDLKLDRMRALLHRLGDPQDQLSTVHVAGSKGKGSTCAMLASVLRCAGCRTGLFTSPHLSDVRERIQVDGEMIARGDLATLMAEIRPAVEQMESAGEHPTFFEVGTALGFLHFLRKKCDIGVIEVGLGGRFDSTNVITPLVSIITSISLDHTEMLGETVEQIAFEKAGIVKPGVPVVSGVTEPGPRAVIERVAAERRAPLLQLGVDFTYSRNSQGKDVPHDVSTRFVNLQGGTKTLGVSLALPGEHQRANASIVFATAEKLEECGIGIAKKALIEGFETVTWPARCEVFFTRPPAVLDCAHNIASAHALIETLDELALPRGGFLIFAASSDKDIGGLFRVLVPHFRRIYLTQYQQSTRAVTPEKLAEFLPPEVERKICATPADAWRAAVADATPETLVVIAGSVFLAGEIRPVLLYGR